ncbi:MAG: hypothetical protein WBH55_16455, partial [Bacteroidota bacterium]
MRSLAILLSMFVFAAALGQDVVELRLPNSNKVVIKLMFRNGSIVDPAGKEGLTLLTAQLVAQGGTQEMTYSQIQDAIYPMAS